MDVKLVWATPNAEDTLAYCARASSSQQDTNPNPPAFVEDKIRLGHWSVLDMANMCVEITTSLPIATQIIRHWSMHEDGGHWDGVQQQSRRYDGRITWEPLMPARLQSATRRSPVWELAPDNTDEWWQQAMSELQAQSESIYKEACKRGICREQSRFALLQTIQSKVCINGTLRSWYHYCVARLDAHAQEEHRLIAMEIHRHLSVVAPTLAQMVLETQQ